MKNKGSIYQLTTCALMAALMCVLGPMSVPIGPVPVTFTNLVIYLAIILLGLKGAFVSTSLYLMLGLVGLPVFSNYSGGPSKLAGPTGGYLIGFLFVALIAGYVVTKTNRKIIPAAISMVVGTAVLYAFGTMWFIYLMDCDLSYAMTLCVTPFIPFDLIKIALALLLGKSVVTALDKAHLLPEME